jgi:hypothetical protein
MQLQSDISTISIHNICILVVSSMGLRTLTSVQRVLPAIDTKYTHTIIVLNYPQDFDADENVVQR